MGTTLTGTTPQDTYDSLIKVTDNGPISGTAKFLSDGLGNDSVLALSNARVGVASTSPLAPLQVGNTTINNAAIGSSLVRLLSRSTANDVQEIGLGGEGSITMSAIGNLVTDGGSFAKGAIYFATRDVTTNTAPTERMRITSAGSVQIGIAAAAQPRLFVFHNDATEAGIQVRQEGAAPIQLWQTSNGVEVLRATSVGLTFNGDSAAANALDDYEEGTWTIGVSFSGASVGVTTSSNTGTYTKIGRQVTVNGLIVLTSKGSSSGTAAITGLPFTVPNSTQNYAAANVWLVNISFANQFQAINIINTTRIELYEITEAGILTVLNEANFANNSEVILSLTYFV